MERYRYYSDASRFILPAVDSAVILGAFHLASYQVLHTWRLTGYVPFCYIIFGLLWILLAQHYANIYRSDRLISYGERLRYLGGTFLLHAVLVLAAVLLLPVPWLSAPYVVAVYGYAVAGVLGGRVLLTAGYRFCRRHLLPPGRRFVVVGASPSGQELHRLLSADDPDGQQCQGFFSDEPLPPALRALYRGPVADVQAYCREHAVEELYFALPLDRHALIEELSTFAADNFLAFRIVPDYGGTVRQNVSVMLYEHLPILTVGQEPLAIRTNQVVKRAFDIGFAGLVVFGVFPFILPVLALLIRLDSPGPVFFKQLRPGRRNRLFPCYKLRTMHVHHGQPELQATKTDPRVTRVGAYLRRYNLDELPQFFNVLLGHMSVVGPRPNLICHLEEYSRRGRTYQLRHAVMPGITGYAQVNGCRGETRALGAMEKRVEYDLKYLRNWSFGLDVQIILKTVRNMVRGEENAF